MQPPKFDDIKHNRVKSICKATLRCIIASQHCLLDKQDFILAPFLTSKSTEGVYIKHSHQQTKLAIKKNNKWHRVYSSIVHAKSNKSTMQCIPLDNINVIIHLLCIKLKILKWLRS